MGENPRKVIRGQKTKSHLRKRPPILQKVLMREIMMTVKLRTKLNMTRWVGKLER